MTQAELGEKLNVTFQAVSKWERGESYPDFDTMSKIAKLFDVSLEYFSEEGEQPKEMPEEKKEMLGVCKECGKTVYEGEEHSTSPVLICKACAARKKEEENRARLLEKQKQEAEKRRAIAAEQTRRATFKRKRNWGLFWGTLATVAFTVIYLISTLNNMNTGLAIGSLVAADVFVFAFVSQFYWGGAVRDVAACGGKVIGTPGIIFSFDLDGFIFLIGMKILFAVIRFIIWLVTVLFFGAIGFIISPITFIPRIIKLNMGIETDDEIYDAKTGEII